MYNLHNIVNDIFIEYVTVVVITHILLYIKQLFY